MKKILLLCLFFVSFASFGQNFPVQNLQVLGTTTATGLATFNGGLSVSNGFFAPGQVTTSDLATQAANTVLANGTAFTTSPIAYPMPSCFGSSNALTWVPGTGFGCSTTLPSLSANNTWTGTQTFQGGTTLWVQPQTYGALANSNGTTGNGHDDSAAITAAINAAAAQNNPRSLTGGVVYFPCGIYRIASGISWTSNTSGVHLLGAGACSQIYNDSAAPVTTMSFTGNNCSNSTAPCVSVEGLNFISPTNPSTSAYALSFNGVSAPTVKNNIINGYGRGINLAGSFGPIISYNTFSNLQGAALLCIADDSCNNASIWENRVFFVGNTVSEASFKIGPNNVSTACIGNPDNVSFMGNDIELSYSGPQFLGSCSVSIRDNYIAQNFAFAFNFSSPGFNRAVKIEGNYFAENGGTINGPGPWTFSMANVAGVDFGTNSWFHQNLTWTGLTAINWSAFQIVTTGSSLQNYCNETQNCSYLTNGWIHQWGSVTTSGGTASVTFPLACPNAAPSEIMLTNANGTNATVWVGTSSTTGMTVNSSIASAFLTWGITCK